MGFNSYLGGAYVKHPGIHFVIEIRSQLFAVPGWVYTLTVSSPNYATCARSRSETTALLSLPGGPPGPLHFLLQPSQSHSKRVQVQNV